MRGRIRIVQFQRRLRGQPRFPESIRRGAQPENRGIHQRFGAPGVGLRIGWIALNRAIEELKTLGDPSQARVEEIIVPEVRFSRAARYSDAALGFSMCG